MTSRVLSGLPWAALLCALSLNERDNSKVTIQSIYGTYMKCKLSWATSRTDLSEQIVAQSWTSSCPALRGMHAEGDIRLICP